MHWQHYGLYLLGVLAISFSAVFVKWATVEPTVSAFYRTFYSIWLLLGLAWLFPQKEFQKNNLRWIWPSLLAAFFLAVDLILWHRLILEVGSGIATLLGNSQVIFVALWAAWLFRERVTGWLVLFIPLIFLGLYLSIPGAEGRMAWPHLLTGLAVGATYAGFLLGLHYAKQRTGPGYPEILSLAVIMAATSLFLAGYALLVEPRHLNAPGFHNQAIMLLMALIPNSLGWIVLKTQITKIPAHEGSLLLLLQPVLTVIWGGWFFGEPLTVIQLGGILLSLGALGIYQWKFAGRSSYSGPQK